MEPTRRNLARYDARQLRAHGVLAIAGVDEVGRGCLAGPVVAAAVILPAKTRLPGVDDSKKLTREQRETQALAVRAVAIAIGVSFVGPRVIETINIRGASLLAMRRAVHRARVRLRRTPEAAHGGSLLVLVDGLDVIPGVELRQHAVVSGDGTSLAIAAASIVAKTMRDRFMVRLAAEWPSYGFERHVGYGTEEHLEALDRHGPCRWHRYSFSPIAQTELFALHALEDALP
jgi:ribonuclease HII